MARRKKGRALTGWLVVDKPMGVTSAAVVNRVRWQLQAQKAGHAGTLDPDATGLLVIAFGEATKALAPLTDALKTYEFAVNWGSATDTDDASGVVLQTSDARPEVAEIEALLPRYTGDITQVPPQVSAVKVDGQRAYDLARAGEVMELAARPLYVDALDLVEATPDQAVFRMTCGKGGYVRSIARDMGRDLGCFGHVAHLRRTASGPFAVDGAYPFDPEGPDQDPLLEASLLPLEAGLRALPECTCDRTAAARLRHGNPAPVRETGAENDDMAWASCEGAPLALGIYRDGMFFPQRVFNLDT